MINDHDIDLKIKITFQVLTEVTLEVGSLGEEVGAAVPLPEGEEVASHHDDRQGCDDHCGRNDQDDRDV